MKGFWFTLASVSLLGDCFISAVNARDRAKAKKLMTGLVAANYAKIMDGGLRGRARNQLQVLAVSAARGESFRGCIR